MKLIAAVPFVVFVAFTTHANAVEGCLTPEEDLARRSDVVVVAKIDRVESATLEACPEPSPHTGVPDAEPYRRCGAILLYAAQVSDRLRGNTPASVSIRVPLPSFLSLSCDDRPAAEEMAGTYAVLFLKSEQGAYWLVDGPNGVYASRSPILATEVARVRRILSAVARVDDPPKGK